MLNRVKELSEIERKVLLVLSDELISFENCSKLSLLPIDSVRRASAWLSEKDFAIMKESTEEKFVLTDLGNKALLEGLPESIFLSALSKLGGRASFSDLQKASKLSSQEFTAALGINKRKAFIVIVNGVIEETGVANDQPNSCENILQNVVDGKEIEDGLLLDLQKRGLVEKKLVTSRLIKISKNGGVAQKILSTSDIERTFDVSAPVPEIFAGKKTPYVQFLQQIRHKLVALGLKKLVLLLLLLSFTILMFCSNHKITLRTWTDSYQLLKPRVGSLPNKKIVSAIKSAHENGGVSKSKGWGYEWSESIASRAVPAMHGTAHSARQLVKGVKSPHKYFAIARCFRPDVLDATHLIEFNQMEGFVVGDDLNFKHLLGMLKDFAIEFAGAEKVKFFPDYYPFTEPSVQLSAKHPEMGWIEFAGQECLGLKC